jgi:hypothetical protein
MALGLEQLKEWMPGGFPLFAPHEGVHVADEYDAVAGTGDEDIQPFWGGHEPNVA